LLSIINEIGIRAKVDGYSQSSKLIYRTFVVDGRGSFSGFAFAGFVAGGACALRAESRSTEGWRVPM
jgi:hypothetical protein